MFKKNWLVVLFLLVSFGMTIGMTGCGQNATSQETENLRKELDELKKQKEDEKLAKDKEELASEKEDLAEEKQKLESDKKKSEAKKDNTSEALSNIKKGMLYASARKVLMNGGWKPLKSGSNNNDPDEDEAGNAQTESVRRKFPEVVDCAPTGYAPCTFQFRNSNNKTLWVYTTGEDNQTVKSWEIQ